MQTIILPDLFKTEFDSIYVDRAVDLGIKGVTEKRFMEKTKGLWESFVKIFLPFFSSDDPSRFDEISQNTNEFLRRLKISVQKNKDEEMKKITAFFWKKINEEILQDSRSIGNQYLINSCNYLVHEIDLLFDK